MRRREALLAQQHVAAVTGVDAPYGVVLREMTYISVALVDVRLGMQSFHEIAAVAQRLHDGCADAGHDRHIQHNIYRIGQFDTDFCKLRADYPHRIGDDVHLASLHRAVEQFAQLFIALGGRHPVVEVAGVLLFSRTDIGTPFDTRDVVHRGTVKITVGEQFYVELYYLACRHRFVAQLLKLFFTSVDVNDLVGRSQGRHFVYPLLYFQVYDHYKSPFHVKKLSIIMIACISGLCMNLLLQFA